LNADNADLRLYGLIVRRSFGNALGLQWGDSARFSSLFNTDE